MFQPITASGSEKPIQNSLPRMKAGRNERPAGSSMIWARTWASGKLSFSWTIHCFRRITTRQDPAKNRARKNVPHQKSGTIQGRHGRPA